jgi:hypothetical protein|tara:strand:- start:782 stop:991 length:210 start_codon:yes stop_codon:yes gene_type:complete
MKNLKLYSLPFVFLWGSSIGYIFLNTYKCNNDKLKMIEKTNKITETQMKMCGNADYDKFQDLTYNPFKY